MGASYQNPTRDCDLVMKGGITSGVVYPEAVLELADTYRFRSLGGGSVGAVAAALAAAAELGRDRGGFEKLKEEQEKLRGEGFLLEIFRPTARARPLMDTLLDLVEARNEAKARGKRPWVAVLRSLVPILVRHNPGPFVKGALAGVALGVATVYVLAGAFDSALAPQSLYAAMFVVGAVSAFLAGLAWTKIVLLRVLLREVPSREGFYGMSTGHGEHDPDRKPLLTDWLSGLLDNIAGVEAGRPLTFGDLRGRTLPGGEEAGIRLEMMTTNLNHNEPYVFPREHNTFVFNADEMRRFFPGYVVDHMVRNAAPADVQLADGFHFLPQGDDLPVIVPVRMAISFPILLCAVPLRTVEAKLLEEQRAGHVGALDDDTGLLMNWFSDGGICSNFPIHSFDAWLPRYPTFGINLTSLPKEQESSTFSLSNVDEAAHAPPASKSEEKVRLPRPDDPDYAEWSNFSGIVGFAMAIFHSAQNYRDTMQSRLPSYQERIVQVRLGEDEGGLNLGMGKEVVAEMVERGGKAGRLLKNDFRPDHHRWVRLRVLMNQLETQLDNTETALDEIVAEDLLDRQRDDGFPYQLLDERRVAGAKEALRELQTLTRLTEQHDEVAGQPGGPGRQHLFPRVTDEDLQPTLRMTPDV